MSLYPDFFDSVRSLYQITSTPKSDFGGFWQGGPVLQIISQGCVLTYGIWWIYLHCVKNPPNVQCTLYNFIHGVTLQNHTSSMPNYINSVPWMHAVTSTPYLECTLSHQLRTMNERGHTNSVPWMHAVCRLCQATFIQFNQKIFSTNCVQWWYEVCVTAFVHGTELMRFGKVTLRSTKISIKWLWPVKVTLEVIKRRLMVFCWSCDEGPLK